MKNQNLDNESNGIPPILSYGAEMARSRFWQEAQLAAMRALIAASPPSPEELEKSPAGITDYAKNIVRAAFAIADEANKQHGPSYGTRLQKVDPFVAAPGVKDADAEEEAE